MQHTIIEFKARCADLDAIRQKLKQRQARFAGTDHQIDTYFRVPQGRLKLREGNIENSLVFYSRENHTGTKQSNVTMTAMPPQTDLKAVLDKALGVMVAVDKKREIYFVGDVKIHLDEVAGLGTFVEVEAIGSAEQRDELQRQCDEFLREFGITQDDLVGGSYSDLLTQA
jgi:adenylate cyclase, class 2